MRFTIPTAAITTALFTGALAASAATVSGTFSGTIISGTDVGVFAPVGTNLAGQAISGSFSYNSSLLITNDYPPGSPAGGASWFDPNAGSITQMVAGTSFVFGSTNYFNVFVGNPPSEPEDIFEIAANAYLPATPVTGQNYTESYDLISFESYANFLSGTGPDQNPAITSGQILGEDEFYLHTWDPTTNSYNVTQDLIYFDVTTLDGVTVAPLSSAPEPGTAPLLGVATAAWRRRQVNQ